MKLPERRRWEKIKLVTNIITIIIFVGTIIGGAMIFAANQNQITNDIKQCSEKNIDQDIEIEMNGKNIAEIITIIAEMQIKNETDNEWIKNTLVEIKEELK